MKLCQIRETRCNMNDSQKTDGIFTTSHKMFSIKYDRFYSKYDMSPSGYELARNKRECKKVCEMRHHLVSISFINSGDLGIFILHNKVCF